MTSGVLAAERGLEVVVLGRRPADQAPAGRLARRRSTVRADRRVRRVLAGHCLDQRQPAGALLRRHDGAMPGSRRPVRGDRCRVGLRRDDLQRPGGAGAERLLDLRVADARGVPLGHDLDRRHAGVEAEHRERRARPSTTSATAA